MRFGGDRGFAVLLFVLIVIFVGCGEKHLANLKVLVQQVRLKKVLYKKQIESPKTLRKNLGQG